MGYHRTKVKSVPIVKQYQEGKAVADRSPRRLGFLVLALAVAVFVSASGHPTLTLGTPLDGELAGGAVHSFEVDAEESSFLRLRIASRNNTVLLTLTTPDGDILSRLETVAGDPGGQELEVVLPLAGRYRIAIRNSDPSRPAGFSMTLLELRLAEPRDQARVTGWELFRAAQTASRDRTADAWRQAIAHYAESLPHWRQADEPRGAAMTLNSLGFAHQQLGELSTAVTYYQQALELWRQAADLASEADTLGNLAAVRRRTGEVEEALVFYRQALELKRAVGDSLGQARILNGLGLASKQQGDLLGALDHYRQALALMRSEGHRASVAATLLNIASVQQDLGEAREAVEHYRQAAEIYTERGDEQPLAVIANNLGVLFQRLGDFEQATFHFERALPYFEQAEDDLAVARMINNLGWNHLKRDQPRQAAEHFERALPFLHQAEEKQTAAIVEFNLAQAEADLGKAEAAIERWRRALEEQRRGGFRRDAAWTLIGLGRLLSGRGQLEKAAAHLDEALELSREVRDRWMEAEVLFEQAKLARQHGEREKALAQIEASIALLESLRSGTASLWRRATLGAFKRGFYELLVDVLMELDSAQPMAGFAARAFQASERARARGLLDLLDDARVELRRDVEATLLDAEKRLRSELNPLELERLRQDDAASPELEQRIEGALIRLEELRARIRAASPRYGALTSPPLLGVEEIQALLDPESALLELALGEERSFLWVVTATSFASHILPPGPELEEQARTFYQLLDARARQLDGSLKERQERLIAADAALERAAARLSDDLLAPVAAHLSHRRLFTVMEGALSYVPFAALPKPRGSVRPSDAGPCVEPCPLVVDHELVSLPSASLLAVLRSETSRKRAPRTLAVMADPVFDRGDPRLARSVRMPGGVSEKGSGQARRARPDPSVDPLARRFSRLRFSQREAEAIVALLPGEDSLLATGFAASRRAVLEGELAGYRIVHFATHGLLNSRFPDLSALVLSLVDEEGRSVDGFLRLHDIYNLDLNAELVVLSACQTAVGREIRGEGLLGLTRGFMHAGARQVLASLWSVQDRATKELMARFYEHLLRRDLPASEALRRAQVELWRDERFRSPYYWAGFILQGDGG